MVKRDKAKRQDVPPAEPAPMPAAHRPQYRACTPVKMTDGLQKWIEYRFDTAEPSWTEDDRRAWRESLEAGTPAAQIREMKERLDALDESAHPAIPAHVRRIRDIHDSLSTQALTSGNASLADSYLLDEAEHLWLKIMVLRDVMPRARVGKTFREQSKGRRRGKATVYLRELRRQGETAKELWKRLKEQPDPNAPVYIDERDVMIDKSSGKEISINSLEERLNRRKSQ